MSLKIFVIDDEVSIRDSLKWYLEDLGHEVIAVAAPVSCDVYQGHICSQTAACGEALLIDYKMPGVTGLEFIERLKERGCKGMTENMLIMSGDALAIDKQKAAELGCRIVQKPMSFTQLDAWLDEIMRRKNAKTAAAMDSGISLAVQASGSPTEKGKNHVL